MIEVLYVDASAPARGRIAAALPGPEFGVTVAETAEAALYECAHRDVDVVVTALDLGGMDGIELCRVLKARSTVPVVVAAPSAQHATTVAAFEAGADDVIVADRQHREVPARVRALWRRCRGPLLRRRPLRLGTVVLEWRPDGQLHPALGPAMLTPEEATVLSALAERVGCVVHGDVLRRRLAECHGSLAAGRLDAILAHLHHTLQAVAAPAAVHRVPDDACVLLG